MKSGPIWKVSVVTTLAAEDAVAESLQNVFRQPASSWTDLETAKTTVAVYLSKRPDVGPARIELLGCLRRIKACGLDVGAGKVAFERVRSQDWAESWKRHFKPIDVGRALLVRPGWSRRRPRKGQAEVVLDPGLSFGTGQHPTTGFCLEQLVARRRSAVRQSFLDIGTGSGILAIAAAKLGYSPVEALDFDPESVRAARANARRNRVQTRVRIRRADLTKLPRQSAEKYSLVCANLVSDLLIAERRRLASRLETGGILVLAGILKAEFPAVQRAYGSLGVGLITARTEGEWRSGAFEFGRGKIH